MKNQHNWHNWLQLRESTGSQIGRDVAGDQGYSSEEGQQLKTTWEMSDIAWRDHTAQVKNFYQDLASRNPELRTLLDKIEQEGTGHAHRAAERSADYGKKNMGVGDEETVSNNDADSNPGMEDWD